MSATLDLNLRRTDIRCQRSIDSLTDKGALLLQPEVL